MIILPQIYSAREWSLNVERGMRDVSSSHGPRIGGVHCKCVSRIDLSTYLRWKGRHVQHQNAESQLNLPIKSHPLNFERRTRQIPPVLTTHKPGQTSLAATWFTTVRSRQIKMPMCGERKTRHRQTILEEITWARWGRRLSHGEIMRKMAPSIHSQIVQFKYTFTWKITPEFSSSIGVWNKKDDVLERNGRQEMLANAEERRVIAWRTARGVLATAKSDFLKRTSRRNSTSEINRNHIIAE